MNRHGSMTRKGFTLVELLVSITLTIFILTLFATLFGAGNDAVRAARGSGEIDRSVQGSITKIKRDLEHVYIGEGVRLSEAFTSANSIPSAGYFTIEENLPASLPYYCQSETAANAVTSPAHDPNFQARVQAINTRLQMTRLSGYTGDPRPAVGYRQGIDDRGLPVEVDVDDVLAFTVRLSGDSASDIFYGRVPVGSVLDNDLDPGSRFDSPDNGQFTSPLAEVCYFLRADRPYELAEINRPALGTDDGRLARAATYTLYRRELLVLSESQRTRVEERLVSELGSPSVIVDMTRPVVVNSNASLQSGNLALFNPSIYQNYDVSVRYWLNPPNPTGSLVRFNDIKLLRVRDNRYGMGWRPPGSVGNFPSFSTGEVTFNPQHVGPFYYSPAYYSGLDVTLNTLGVPAASFGAGVRPLLRGRPTLFESTLVGSTGFQNDIYNPANLATHASWDFSNSTFGFDDATQAPRPVSARRGNADVLLTNVLSFDVKVLNDDVQQGIRSELIASNATTVALPTPFTRSDLDASNVPVIPIDLTQWPACRTSSLLPLSPTDQQVRFTDLTLTQQVFRPGLPAANVSRRSILAPAIQSDFVDLGQSLVREFPAGFGLPQGGRTWDQEARTTFGQAIGRQLFSGVIPSPNPDPQVPWGRHTPARWISLGRWEAFFNAFNPILPTPLYPAFGAVYDTWAPEYNANSFAQEFFAPISKTKYLPPYDRPVRGIQITIRTLEPRSGLVREFQIVHRF